MAAIPTFLERVAKAWNAFRNRDPTPGSYTTAPISYYRPDERRRNPNSQRSIIAPLLNRLSVDAATIEIKHIKLDEKKRYKDDIESGLNDVLTLSANLDQTARAFRQDMYASLLDEGYVALCPVQAEMNKNSRELDDVYTVRTGRIVGWAPEYVTVEVYNEATGRRETITQSKHICSIVQNPFYDIMNAPNSLMVRLRKKLAMLDYFDEQSANGKLDLIIQFPFSTRAENQQKRAEERKHDIEMQLGNSKYGIAYLDSAEKIIQLNRSLDNNLVPQIESLTKQLMDQLGISPEIMNGSASDDTQQSYLNNIIEPIVSAVVDEMKRKWISRERRKNGETIMFFKDPFRLMPVSKIADMADKFTRNEIMSSNEFRVKCGLKPSDQEGADDLRNKNINQSAEQLEAVYGKHGDKPAGERDQNETSESSDSSDAALDEILNRI